MALIFFFYSSADMCDVLRLETSPKYYFPPPCAIHNLKEKNKTAREDSIDEKWREDIDLDDGVSQKVNHFPHSYSCQATTDKCNPPSLSRFKVRYVFKLPNYNKDHTRKTGGKKRKELFWGEKVKIKEHMTRSARTQQATPSRFRSVTRWGIPRLVS